MINKEESLDVLKQRLKRVKDDLNLKTFKKTPTRPLNADMFPAIVLSSGKDDIIKANSRHPLGLPAKRGVDVSIEYLINKKEFNVENYNKIRQAIFTVDTDEGPRVNVNLTPTSYITEKYIEGPVGSGIPDTVVVTIVLYLVYTDNGF